MFIYIYAYIYVIYTININHESCELGACCVLLKGWPTIPGRQSEKSSGSDGENVVEIASSVAKKKAEWTLVFMVDI